MWSVPPVLNPIEAELLMGDCSACVQEKVGDGEREG